MPKPIPVPTRQLIVERHQRGETLKSIAEDLNLPYYTVRNIWRRYRDHGEPGLQLNYEACGQTGPRCSKRVYRAALWLRGLHRTWGAPLIRSLIQQRWPEENVPHERTLQRWFREAGIQRKRPKKLSRPPPKRGREVHAVWAMDAKERMKMENGEQISWLLISDECSGAILTGEVFPPRALGKS